MIIRQPWRSYGIPILGWHTTGRCQPRSGLAEVWPAVPFLNASLSPLTGGQKLVVRVQKLITKCQMNPFWVKCLFAPDPPLLNMHLRNKTSKLIRKKRHKTFKTSLLNSRTRSSASCQRMQQQSGLLLAWYTVLSLALRLWGSDLRLVLTKAVMPIVVDC